MFWKLLPGVALAAAVVLPQVATAGRCGCPCGARYVPAAPVRSVIVPPDATASGSTVVPPGPADSTGPPVASGEGRVIRRYSYEPGSDAAPISAGPAPVYDSDFGNFRAARPAYRSVPAIRQGRSAAGLTGEARQHPGRRR